MKIAFVGFEDINDIKLWAGIPYFIGKTLENAGVQVVYIKDVKPVILPIQLYAKRLFYNKIQKYQKGVYKFSRNKKYLIKKSAQIDSQLKRIDPDIVLCCTPFQIAYLNTDKPIVTWTDATFKLLNSYYPDYMRYCKESVKDGEEAEALALNRINLLVYSAKWAADSAKNDYGSNPEKVKVIPFGANIKGEWTSKVINKEGRVKTINLLFVGFDPVRKGLQKAIEVTDILNQQGITTRLTVIGPKTLDGYESRYIIFKGQLDKDKPEELEAIKNAYSNADFFILPTTTEAFGIVFCEAMSYGVPCLSHDVGGISDIIINHINGMKFPVTAKPEDFAAVIHRFTSNPDKYLELRKTTYRDYSDRLNWKRSISSLIQEMKKLI